MEPYQLGLLEALNEIAKGNLSIIDFVQSCIARTNVVEPAVHAFAYFDQAAVVTALTPPPTGPLAGMPIGVKDIISTAGVPTEMGSAAFKGHVPEQSAWVIDALTRAGAFVFGKTVTTEFAWRHPGNTRNPWNTGHTPGGSSSGSAAAVACGCVPAALGTQTLGSILRPAAFCGVVGFKPSFGSIPRTGVYAFAHSLDHLGVFTRNVSDAAFLATLLFGQDGIDFPRFAPPSPAWPVSKLTRPPKIALIQPKVWGRVSQEQQAAVEQAALRLEAAGAEVIVKVLPPAFDNLWLVAKTIADAEGAAINEHIASEKPSQVGAPTHDLVKSGQAIDALTYLRAKSEQAKLSRLFDAFASDFDACLTAPALGEAPKGTIDTGDALLCTPFSLFGTPAITLPVSRSVNGLPLGVQLVGRWSMDKNLMNVASWIEQQLNYMPGFPQCHAVENGSLG